MNEAQLALSNLMDELAELHAECTRSIRLIEHFHPNNKRGLSELRAKRNAIQECINKAWVMRHRYSARSLTG